MNHKPTSNPHKLGISGEKHAQRFLASKGYRIIATNYRNQWGEIDIVCQDGDTLVFVEVKTRSSEKFGSPAEAVNYNKRNRLRRLAQIYLVTHRLESIPVRFDVLSLIISSAKIEIEHLIGAF
ncbi:MAG: YraN family protein [bacterium]